MKTVQSNCLGLSVKRREEIRVDLRRDMSEVDSRLANTGHNSSLPGIRSSVVHIGSTHMDRNRAARCSSQPQKHKACRKAESTIAASCLFLADNGMGVVASFLSSLCDGCIEFFT